MLKYISRSTSIPVEWDTSSSPTTIYHNYNILEKEAEDGILYEYEVEQYSKEEYNILLINQIQNIESRLKNIEQLL